MVVMREIGRLQGGSLAAAMEHAEFHVELVAGRPQLRLVDYTGLVTVHLDLAAGILPVEVGFGLAHGRNRPALTVDGTAGTINHATMLAAQSAAGAETGSSVSGFLSRPVPGQWFAAEVMVLREGGQEYLLAARPGGAGLDLFRLQSGQEPLAVQRLEDRDGLYLDGVSTMASARVGGVQLVFAGSVTEHGITVLRLDPGGVLVPLRALGMAESIPVQQVTALKTAVFQGETWLIAAASGSSSLTVFRVEGPEGRLVATDQVIDSLDTRFQGVKVIELVEVGGHVLVLAAGKDDGISLFTLSPSGKLIHLQTIEDTAGMSLSNVTAIDAVLVGAVLQIYTVSGAEPGLSVLEIEVAGLGSVIRGAGVLVGTSRDDLIEAGIGTTSLDGGAGDDVLIDGPGTQVMRGGTGADVFVMVADGALDRILDFDPREDRIDLSAWPMFRGAGQLTFTQTANGGVIEYRNERLEIVTANGQPLTLAQIQLMKFGTEVTHLDPAWIGDGNDGTFRDRIEGGAGADLLSGSAAAEHFIGGSGSDTLLGGGGRDIFDGGAGFDVVSFAGLPQRVVLDLGRPDRDSSNVSGNLYLEVDGFIGTAFDDEMVGTSAADWFAGGAGNDRLIGGGGRDTLWGGEGDDILIGAAEAAELHGGPGKDLILFMGDGTVASGGDGDDVFVFGLSDPGRLAEAQRISGIGSAPDTLRGGDAGGVLNGNARPELIHGGDGNDTIDGLAGSDTIWGGGGDDRILGGTGDDLLFGEMGNDQLFGGAGNDRLYGGPGDDTLAGGAGDDTLSGGGGVDVFEFQLSDAGRDVILDFEDGSDRIRITGLAGASEAQRFASLSITEVMGEGGLGTLIRAGGMEIFLEGVAPGSIGVEDFFLM